MSSLKDAKVHLSIRGNFIFKYLVPKFCGDDRIIGTSCFREASRLRFYEGVTVEANLQPTVLLIEVFAKRTLLIQYWLT